MKIRLSASTLTFLVVAIVSGAACWWLKGADVVIEAVASCGDLILYVLPQIVAGILIGGFAQQLVSKERMAELLGGDSGLMGLVLASFAGFVTPGGPFTSFPLVYALWVAGADAGALVAYLSSWAILGLNRLLIWELPFLGVEFSLLRFVVCLPFPILAGIIARVILARTSFHLGPRPEA